MLKKIVFATALLAVAAGASAASYDWGVHAAAESNLASVPSGAFSDTYTFSLGSGEEVTSSVVSLNLLSAYDISGGSYSLWMVGGSSPLDTWSFDGTTGSSFHTVDLAAGSYYYMVLGTADGTADATRAGIYDIASTVIPVPEPESYALLLGGLGLVGFVAGRRGKQR